MNWCWSEDIIHLCLGLRLWWLMIINMAAGHSLFPLLLSTTSVPKSPQKQSWVYDYPPDVKGADPVRSAHEYGGCGLHTDTPLPVELVQPAPLRTSQSVSQSAVGSAAAWLLCKLFLQQQSGNCLITKKTRRDAWADIFAGHTRGRRDILCESGTCALLIRSVDPHLPPPSLVHV